MREPTREEILADDPLMKPIDVVAVEQGLSAYETKMLRGAILSGNIMKPIGSLTLGLVRDDDRLQRWLKNLRPAFKSTGRP